MSYNIIMFRLKELRMENGLKRSEFAKAVNLPVTTIANYENETRQAPYELLFVFAAFFEVSVDYLLGREEGNAVGSSTKNDALLTSDEKELLKDYRKCDRTGKSRICEYARIWREIRRD